MLETNWFSRDCQRAWFSFGETWQPASLPLLRTMRSRDANKLIATWLDDRSPQGRLFVECDYDGRIPRYRPLCDSRSLLTRTLRLRILSTPDGVSRPIDEQRASERALRLRALTADVIEDRAQARPFDPPVWREPPNFLYHAELAVRLAGRHHDYGESVHALRSLAIRHAYLDGRTETDETDWSLLARVLADSVPPWLRRIVEHLSASPKHKAQAETLQRIMRLESHNHELARLGRTGILTWHPSQIWSLTPLHTRFVTELVAGRAFQPTASAAAR